MNQQIEVESVEATDYVALTQDAAIVERLEAGVLEVSGDDRRDFLHRMTTNHVNNLAVGLSAVNVLTSSVARIEFVFTVVAQDEALLLLPVAGPADALARHLRSQIFFMDNVHVTDQGQDYARLHYAGPNLAPLEQVLADAGHAQSMRDMQNGAWITQGGALILKQEKIDVPGFELVVPKKDKDRWIAALVEAGANLLTDSLAHKVRRIELGRPWPGHELTGAYNPLEVGLAWVCADDKGCYTGQEIIARQVTYDKVTKTLVGLRSGNHQLSEGTQLTANERAVGEVTSSAFSPAIDAPIALAVVRRPHNEPGTALSANGHDVTVVELPFAKD